MKPATRNIELVRGDTWREVWTFSDANGPVVLTGYVFLSQIRVDTESSTVLATITVTPDADQVANTGQFEVFLADDDSDSLPIGTPSAKWDLQVTDTAGDVRTLVAGTVTVYADVSRT